MKTFLPVRNYALGETLSSGQVFRWREIAGAWEGVIGNRWIRLQQEQEGIHAEIVSASTNWNWLTEYLQTEVDLDAVLSTFPADDHMNTAIAACAGLRLLKQEPWECLASFIFSSTKQIVQIQQIIALLCERFGEPVAVRNGCAPAYSFPAVQRLAALSEAELRACKMGFRAPYLRESAQMIASGELNLAALYHLDVTTARTELMRLPGVGRKIADCVLLFAYQFQEAFPLDVWILKALRQLYFSRKRPSPRRLLEFSQTYFGPNAGYAQQYLFHYMRTRIGR